MSKENENNHPNNNKNPFSMPEGYFDSFSQKMMRKIELADELKEFELLSAIEKKNPFSVPQNYFELKDENALYPYLYTLRDKQVFSVPQNYFVHSGADIINKTEALEELNGYSLLKDIKKENSFVIPDLYFEKSSGNIYKKLSAVSNKQQPANVLQIVFSRKTVYAIAAMLVISLGLYFFNANTEAAMADCNTLACLSRNEIVNGAQINTMDEDALIEAVNTDKLSKNLNKVIEQENKNKENENTTVDYVLENADVNEIADEI